MSGSTFALRTEYEPSADFCSYIMLVNMPAALQINLQTDGKSRIRLAGMFLSWRHGIKVSSGMSHSPRPSPAWH